MTRPIPWTLTLSALLCLAVARPLSAQPEAEPAAEEPPVSAPLVPGADPPPAATVESDAGFAAVDDDGGTLVSEASVVPPEEPRGDTPVSVEEIVGEAAPATEPPPVDSTPGPSKEPQPPADATPAPGPLVVWATAEWGNTLGSARCGAQGLADIDAALRVASALKASTAVAGLGIATGGGLSNHPLLAYAGRQRPEELADLLKSLGFAALALGVSDLRGPLFSSARLSEELSERDVTVVASNLVCAGQAYCQRWHTAEDPLTIIERNGRRYALISLLPDDVLGRVQPQVGEQLVVRPALEAMLQRLQEATHSGVDLVVAHIDHGPDATAAVSLASFVSELPRDVRPDLLLSPSAGENLLFLRPLDVQPAIVGTRRDALTGVRVQRIDERDADVLARTVRLPDANREVAAQLGALGAAFCRERTTLLPGGRLERPMNAAELVSLAAAAARQLARADLALVDPRAFEPDVAFAAGQQLQAAEVERAVPFDAPLVVANVSLDWLGNLRKELDGLRPLTLIGVEQDKADTLIAGRLAVPGASYRIVTTAVLARSGRLPAGADFEPLQEPDASLQGALLTLLKKPTPSDPRATLSDQLLGTQWVVRFDGQLLTNLTAVKGRGRYEDPALQANDSRQVGGRLVLNADADAPDYLFENGLQIAFDRNFATDTTAQDLTFLQTTYTYRGLWPKPLFYPHPFAEGYLETSFLTPEDAEFHHLLLRPRMGLRSMFTRVFSLKVAAGVQVELLDDRRTPHPGLGAELLLKPWSIVSASGTLQLEGNVIYYWDSPGRRDDHWLRGQLISSYTLIGPLQATLSVLSVLRKHPDIESGMGLSMQVGLRVRFVRRAMWD